MAETNKTPNMAKPIRRSLVLRHLCDPDIDEDNVREYYDQYFPVQEATAAPNKDDIGSTALDASLEEIRAWLDTECAKEQDRANLARDLESESAVYISSAEDPGMDTKILERIRREGPREKLVEDLLAPLRLHSQPTVMESYDDMKEVLLAWNRRVSGNCDDDLQARQALITALEERLKAANKVLEIVKDEKTLYDEVGQGAILEPSRRRLLQALHAYRPETVRFKNQNPFDMLVVVWANIRRANPDIRGDDDWMYLTFRTLTAEWELARRFVNEDIRRVTTKRKEAAKRRKDLDEIVRGVEEMKKFNKKVVEQSVQYNLDRIKYARSELRKVVLAEMLELTVLQAAQKWAESESRQISPSNSWAEQRDACARADAKLDRTYRDCLEDLEASSEVAANNVQEMRHIHNRVLTRALKFTGKDLAAVDEATSRRIIEERKNQPVTALMMSETLNGVLESQRAATQMLRQVGVMEKSLGELLDVARSQYQEYDSLIRLLNPEDAEELAERGNNGG